MRFLSVYDRIQGCVIQSIGFLGDWRIVNATGLRLQSFFTLYSISVPNDFEVGE